MAKYSEAFAKRYAKLADHARKLIRDDKYSEEEIARFDESLGPMLGKDFYDFKVGKRAGVQQYQPPAITPKPSQPPAAAPNSPPPVKRLRWNPETQQTESR
jgi:hypothetical protein